MAVRTTPIKTGDVVKGADGERYYVRHIQLTGDGVLLHLMKIDPSVKAVHVSEVELDQKIVGESEVRWRAKSAGIRQKTGVSLPAGMSPEQAQRILDMYKGG